MPDQTNHIPAFQFGKYTVEAWGHRSATAVGGTEMIWSIRVDDAWLGSLSASPDLTAPEVMKESQALGHAEPSEMIG